MSAFKHTALVIIGISGIATVATANYLVASHLDFVDVWIGYAGMVLLAVTFAYARWLRRMSRPRDASCIVVIGTMIALCLQHELVRQVLAHYPELALRLAQP